jgi:hypothetical protein
MGRLGEREKSMTWRSPKKKFYVEVRREKKLYLLAIPDCLRCAQYTQNDSVMPACFATKSPKPAVSREYVAVHGDPDS